MYEVKFVSLRPVFNPGLGLVIVFSQRFKMSTGYSLKDRLFFRELLCKLESKQTICISSFLGISDTFDLFFKVCI
jgi:hypothetical protein